VALYILEGLLKLTYFAALSLPLSSLLKTSKNSSQIKSCRQILLCRVGSVFASFSVENRKAGMFESVGLCGVL